MIPARLPILPDGSGWHMPRRPSWRCRICADEWPCATARDDLRAEYVDDRKGLCMYLGSQFWYAIKDIYYRQYPGPEPYEMFARFFGWTRPPDSTG